MALVFSFDNSVHPNSREEWRQWLRQHHARPEGVWYIFARKGSGLPEVTYDEAVEEALAWGWVDSKPAKVDEARHALWMAPRKKGSGWSRPNKERIERLLAQGLMQPAGMAKIEASKKDGTWEKLDAVENLTVPDDLAQALAANGKAAGFWEAFPPSARRGILEWIANARRPETRQARVEETARLAAENKRANQWDGPKKKA